MVGPVSIEKIADQMHDAYGDVLDDLRDDSKLLQVRREAENDIYVKFNASKNLIDKFAAEARRVLDATG
jgi:hypothetical protein